MCDPFANRIRLICVLLETTQILGIIQPINERDNYNIPFQLAYSLLYTGFALTSFYYAYGIIHLRSAGPINDFLCRLCGASLSVWLRFNFLMIVPWALKICLELNEQSSHLWKLLTHPELVSYLFLFCGLTIFLAQLTFFMAGCFFAIGYLKKLKYALQITQDRENHELRNYAQALNQSIGFEMIQINAR
ncbi:uncharacterized protein LOC116805281 [Drosophila grimshawi]|uniref:uncharacterized protein LOC116805281 n=1 Tax=Drosophila grimshawi TaxID=7222 RepID=UPI000C871740|nr:uncharacterized protein LOC116805281 [Drosophila grimshawi]